MELATLHLDTHRLVKHLQSKGYSEDQAEGFIEAIEEIRLTGVTTRVDLENLRRDVLKLLSEFKTEIYSEIDKRFEAADQKIDLLRKEIEERFSKVDDRFLKTEQSIQNLRDEFKDFKADIYKFIFMNSIAVVGLTVTLIKLMS